MRLQVVDNARNLELEPTNAVVTTVVPNRNLGGAGGFARGLMELRDEGWATHVLFMDDDVTFEPEIVARIIALLSFATMIACASPAPCCARTSLTCSSRPAP